MNRNGDFETPNIGIELSNTKRPANKNGEYISVRIMLTLISNILLDLVSCLLLLAIILVSSRSISSDFILVYFAAASA